MDKQRLNLSQVTPGMKLAEPITNAGGVTLMPAGIRLTPMFIVRLKKWDIDTIEVFLDEPKEKTHAASSQTKSVKQSNTSSIALAEAQSEFAKAIVDDVNVWFSNVRENQLMMELRAVAIKRLVAHGPNGMINRMRHPEEAGNATGDEEGRG